MSNPNTDRDERVRQPKMDWQQVMLNGGPPCFFVEGPQGYYTGDRFFHGTKNDYAR